MMGLLSLCSQVPLLALGVPPMPAPAQGGGSMIAERCQKRAWVISLDGDWNSHPPPLTLTLHTNHPQFLVREFTTLDLFELRPTKTGVREIFGRRCSLAPVFYCNSECGPGTPGTSGGSFKGWYLSNPPWLSISFYCRLAHDGDGVPPSAYRITVNCH